MRFEDNPSVVVYDLNVGVAASGLSTLSRPLRDDAIHKRPAWSTSIALTAPGGRPAAPENVVNVSLR